MVFAYSAPSHYLSHCWYIVNWTLGNKLQWNSDQNTKLFIHKNESENIICEIAAILSRGRWVWKQIILAHNSIIASNFYVCLVQWNVLTYLTHDESDLLSVWREIYNCMSKNGTAPQNIFSMAFHSYNGSYVHMIRICLVHVLYMTDIQPQAILLHTLITLSYIVNLHLKRKINSDIPVTYRNSIWYCIKFVEIPTKVKYYHVNEFPA